MAAGLLCCWGGHVTQVIIMIRIMFYLFNICICSWWILFNINRVAPFTTSMHPKRLLFDDAKIFPKYEGEKRSLQRFVVHKTDTGGWGDFLEKNCWAMLAIGVTIQSIDSMGRVRILNITLCFDQLDLYLPCISTYLIVFILFAN